MKQIAIEGIDNKDCMVIDVTNHTLTLALTYSEIGHHQMTLCPIKNLLTVSKMSVAYE